MNIYKGGIILVLLFVILGGLIGGIQGIEIFLLVYIAICSMATAISTMTGTSILIDIKNEQEVTNDECIKLP